MSGVARSEFHFVAGDEIFAFPEFDTYTVSFSLLRHTFRWGELVCDDPYCATTSGRWLERLSTLAIVEE